MDQFLELVKGLGVSGGPVFAILWWLERKERIELRKERDGLLTTVLTSMNTANSALSSIAGGTNDIRATLTKLGEAVTALVKRRGRGE